MNEAAKGLEDLSELERVLVERFVEGYVAIQRLRPPGFWDMPGPSESELREEATRKALVNLAQLVTDFKQELMERQVACPQEESPRRR